MSRNLTQHGKRLVKRVLPGAPDAYRRAQSRGLGSLASTAPSLGDRLGLRRRAFERAYTTGAWTSTGESLSGNGSSMLATQELRSAFPNLLTDLGVRRLLDVPCGDWNWMAHLDLDLDSYVGGDLVPAVVEANQTRFGGRGRHFMVIDLCKDSLPTADLLLCRDALIHFASRDIWRALDNNLGSDIGYVAMTTFPETKDNVDLPETGIQWRHLNLQAAPFGLPAPLRSLADSFNRADQVLSVWSVQDLRAWRSRR